jgi:phytoene synthase
MAGAFEPRPDDIAYLAALLREVDRPRYYATLFAPEPARSELFALYGFAAEIERIADQVRDPMLGRIRQQWWSDALGSGDGEGDRADAPALRAVLSVLTRHGLSVEPLQELIEARAADLYSDPPPTFADAEAYFDKTQSALFLLGQSVIDARAARLTEAAHHVGVAYGLARGIADFAADRARGRTVLPEELLAAEGLRAVDVFAPEPKPALHDAIKATTKLARRHLSAARHHLDQADLPRQAQPVFLPVAIVDALLARADRLGPEITERRVALSDLETLLRLGWARLRGRP